MRRIRNRAWIIFVLCVAILSLVSRAEALPADPNNAALLYYQSFLVLADLDEGATASIGAVAKGDADPNDAVREWIAQCQEAIEFAEAASELEVCDWGTQFSKGFDASIRYLRPMRSLACVLAADARIQAAEGNFQRALERCMMVEMLGRHIGDDTPISYVVSLAVRDMAYGCIQDLMGQIADDAELLEWLRRELEVSLKQAPSLVRAVEVDKDMVLDLLRMEKIESLADLLAEDDEMMRAWIVLLTNEMVLDIAREFYTERITATLSILDRPMPYEKAYTQLKELGVYFEPWDLVRTMTSAFLPAYSRIYELKIRSTSHANALRVAIEICLLRARSGQLPTVLPEGLPKDPFSGDDFEYERTDSGFALRCRAKELSEDTIHDYTFTLK